MNVDRVAGKISGSGQNGGARSDNTPEIHRNLDSAAAADGDVGERFQETISTRLIASVTRERPPVSERVPRELRATGATTTYPIGRKFQASVASSSWSSSLVSRAGMPRSVPSIH